MSGNQLSYVLYSTLLIVFCGVVAFILNRRK
jgi:hypothetical protein